jgi:hypothetical protein
MSEFFFEIACFWPLAEVLRSFLDGIAGDDVFFSLRISSALFILKAAVEPLLVLGLLESTNTFCCWGFHQFGALQSSC